MALHLGLKDALNSQWPPMNGQDAGFLSRQSDEDFLGFNDLTMKIGNQPAHIYIYTLWLFNIAMENGPFIDDFPLKPPFIRDFPWLC